MPVPIALAFGSERWCQWSGAPAARPGTELNSIVVQLCFCLLFGLSLSRFDTLTVDLISQLDI